MELIHELLGYERIKIVQREDMLRLSLDSMLVADFVDTSKVSGKIIDLGTGNAPIPLFLTLKTNSPIFAVDIQEDACKLAKKSVEINGLENQITVINENIKDIYKKVGHDEFEVVVSNPPYFKYIESSKVNKNDFLTIARHEVLITLEELVSEAKKLIIRFVHSKEDDDEALLVLICARKNKKSVVKVLKPLYVYDKNGNYTSEVKNIFNFK